MKKILVSFFAVVVCLSSCVDRRGISERMTDVVNQALSEPISEDDYQLILDQYVMLVDEFYANLDTYTTEEKKEVMAQIGKMSGVIARRGTNTILNRIEGIMDGFPALMEGFLDGFEIEDFD